MKNKELWKDIPEYEGMYQVSNLGRIRSLDRLTAFYNTGERVDRIRKGHVMQPGNSPNGYKIVRLSKDGKPKYFSVHKLVALLFVDNPNKYPQINHINGIKIDNIFSNLEWCTASINQTHAIKTGLIKQWKNQFGAVTINPYAKN